MRIVLILLIFICALFLINCTDYPPTDYAIANPTIKIISPEMNSNVPDSITIRISTNITNSKRVELYIDHYIPSQEAMFNKPPYIYLWNTSLYPDGSQHILQAKAYDSKGNSYDSKFVIVNVYRFSPSYLQAFLKADTLIELDWIDNCKYETGFEIEQSVNDSDFIKIAVVDSNITTYNVIGSFNLNDKYYFRTRAVSKDGYSGYSNIATASVLLNAPADLNFEFISDTAAIVGWTDNNDFETGYVVGKYLANYGIVDLEEVAANTTKTVIKDIFIAGRNYHYLVYAKKGNLKGDAAYFPNVNFIFPPPYDLVAQGLNDHSLKLVWNENNEYEFGFIIERSFDGSNFSEIGNVSTNVHSFTDNTLDTAQNYTYRLIAFSRYNKSEYSPELEVHFSSQLNLINTFQVKSGISWMTMSYDASIVAFGGYTTNDVAVYVYKTFTGEYVQTLNSADPVSRQFDRLTISAGNRLIAAAGDNNYITIWDINSGTVVKRIYNLYHPKVMKFSYDGKYLIVERGGTLRFYNIENWQYDVRINTQNYIYLMDINSDQTIIATGDAVTNVKLWDFNTGSLIDEIPASSRIYALRFNKADTKLYYVVANYILNAWEINSSKNVLTINDFWAQYDIAINENKNIVVGSYSYGGSKGLWELSTGNFIQQFSPDEGYSAELFFTPDDNYLVGRALTRDYGIWSIKREWVSPIN